MEKLISMTDRVLYEMKNYNNSCYAEDEIALNLLKENLENHANFLKQKLELWMFVPCKIVDSVWVVLEEPTHELVSKMPLTSEGWDGKYWRLKLEYQEAKDRVLFEGFNLKNKILNSICNGFLLIQFLNFSNGNKEIHLTNFSIEKPKTFKAYTIEDLIKYNLELTKTAKKQIGL